MTPRLRRSSKANTVSYRESSTESDSATSSSSSEASAPVTRNQPATAGNRRTRSSRTKARRISYREPGSDVEPVSDHAVQSEQRHAKRRRVSHLPQQSVNLRPRRQATQHDHRDTGSGSNRRTERRIEDSRSHQAHDARSTTARVTKGSSSKLTFAAPRRAKSRHGKSTAAPSVATDNKVPLWKTLPYEVLRSIFRYASLPLRDPNDMSRTSSASWLVKAATTCRAFCEPALSSLYEEPPMSQLNQPHELLYTLQLQEDQTVVRYRPKVRRLVFDVPNTLQYTVPGWGHFSLSSLLTKTPQLSEIEITDAMDRAPYRLRGRGALYSYPDDLWDSLERSGVKLKRWRWNGHMIKERAIDFIGEIHQRPSFQSIEHLALSHFQLAEKKSSRRSEMNEVDTISPSTKHAQFATTLKSLSKLKGLSLESINAGDFDDFGQWDWIQLLPNTLSHLKIVNAPYLNSDTLASFLKSHGLHLITLDVSHNQLLDLDFLEHLKSSCPSLETLKMDCTYYSPHELSKDSDPLYDTLLSESIRPTWPASLQEINLTQLRKWDLDAAQTLFESMIDAASELSSLRKINIKANLNISWRERAGFRDIWPFRMQEIFLDKSPDPDPTLASYRTRREWEASKSTRSSFQYDKSPSKKQTAPDDAYLKDKPIQGNCSVVEINIDNLRPLEHYYTEQDFIDSEQSGDDEWRGDGQPSSPRYAW